MLRGTGCVVALPWLESLQAYADTPSAAAFPKRFGVVFLGNGVNENHWSCEGDGSAMKLGKSLEPLEPLKNKINYLEIPLLGLVRPGGERSVVFARPA